jgi:hypothetical protein
MRLTLILRPYYSPQTGRRVHGQFEARLDGKLICISRQPLLDSARVLTAEGVDPATTIRMRHDGATHDAMRATVGPAAKLTVEENERVGPRFARWKPFPRSAAARPCVFRPRARQTPNNPRNATMPPPPVITADEWFDSREGWGADYFSGERRTRWEPRRLVRRRQP